MTKTFTVFILLTLCCAVSTRAQDIPQEKSGGLLDTIYGALFGSSDATAQPADPFGAAPANEAAAEFMDEADSDANAKNNEPPKRIDIVDDFDEAIKLSQLEQRPLLMIAGAEWCSWCRKLENELASDEAESILTKWIVAKIDVDASPALAEEFEINALPSLRVLSTDRTVAAKREGYMPLVELQAWLEEAAPQVDPSVTRVLYDLSPPDEQQLAKLVEFLGNRSASLRQSAMRRLTDTRLVSGGAVVEVLKAGRLAQRLCAIDILRSWGAPVEGLDPWEPDSIKTNRIEDLNSWLENNPAPAADATEPAAAPVDPEKIKDAVTRLLSEPEAKRRALLSEVMSYGKALVPELRARLAGATELGDQQRVRLRQLLMLSIASEQTRGQHANLLTALASLNPDTHRKAASKILEIVRQADQALVDELSGDVDPLVREAAVPALQKIGLLQQPQRLGILLADKNPSVRTAVLREIAKNPKPESIAVLSDHASKETDEDLLVYTAKTLGEMAGQAGVDDTLCGLAQNASWRVRAAALEAFGKRGEHRYDLTEPTVSTKVFEVILRAAEDSDPFVMKRALELLPKLVTEGHVKSVVDFLIKRPERIDSFWAANPEHMQTEISKLLAYHASSFIESEDPAQVRNAIVLLTKISPESLKNKLATLLSSSVAEVRIASLKGTVGYLESIRKSQLAALATTPERGGSGATGEPWYPVPNSFMTLPTPPPIAPVEETDTEPAPEPEAAIPAELAAVDDFFGSLPAEQPQKSETPEPVPNADPAKPTETRPELDLADSLFGGPVRDAPDMGASAATNASSEAIGEMRQPLSSWPSAWIAEYETGKGSENLVELRGRLRELWDSGHHSTLSKDLKSLEQVEAAWLALAGLTSGRQELAGQLASPEFLSPLDARPSSELHGLPVAANILSWLPKDQLFQAIKDHRLALAGEFTDDEKALLNSVTMVENFDVARWLLDNVGSRELSNSQFVTISEYLARALRGAHDRSQKTVVNSSDLRGTAPFKEYAKKAVNTQAALDWLARQRDGELTATQKALLLAQLFEFDYRLGSQSAVGCVALAKEWNREVEVATTIALSAEPRVIVDRAIQWLAHPVKEVQQAALNRLASPSGDYWETAQSLGIAMAHDDDYQVPVFFLAARPLPTEVLKPLMKDVEAEEAWPAYVLLLASGQEELDEWKDDELDSEQQVTIAAALAKTQRVDKAAIDFYRRAARGVEYYESQTLQRVLSGIRNDEVKAIRKSLQSQGHSSFASPPF